MDEEGVEKTRWNFVQGWAMKWTGPSFKPPDSDVAIEALELGLVGLTKA